MGLLNRNQRLNGINPLAYMGVDAYQPSEFLTNTRSPTTSDNNFQLGAIWLYTNITVTPHTEDVYILVALDSGIAKWILFTGNIGTVTELTGNSGGAVPPDAGGNINVLGDTTTVNIVGTPGTNTLTVSTTGTIANSYVEDSGTAAPILNVLQIKGGTSTNGIATNINTRGSTNLVEVNLNNTINLPNTNSAGAGQIQFGGVRVVHNFGTANTWIGGGAGNISLTTAQNNSGLGTFSLASVTTGSNNAGQGNGTLSFITTGSDNVAMGNAAANGLTVADSSNIIFGSGNLGTPGDNNTLRIGLSTGTGAGQLNRSFIAGIRGITTGVNDAIADLIDSNVQLGTISSSIRFKDNVKDLGSISDDVLKLRPVVFNYKSHDAKAKQYGLIAEEVATIMPNLVVHDKAGDPTTVKYHDLPVLLLNELKKLQKRVDLLEHELKSYVNDIQ